jgi:hypothetical protein
LFACALGEVADRALGNPILEMGVHATKGELLAALLARLLEGIVRELSVVAVIMQNFYAVFGSKLFERALGLEGLLGGKIKHEMDESEAREVVHKDGGAGVSLFGKFSFQLRKETHLQGFHLVDGDAFAWLGHNENLVIRLGFLASPGEFCHRPKKATSALRGNDFGQFAWDLAIEHHRLEGRE